MRRVRRLLTAAGAPVLVVLTTSGCMGVNTMTGVGGVHTDPIDHLLFLGVTVPAVVVVGLASWGPCQLAGDPTACTNAAITPVLATGMVVTKLVGTATSPSIWWTALQGEDWIGDDPWGLQCLRSEETTPADPAAPPTSPPPTSPPQAAPQTPAPAEPAPRPAAR